MSNTEESRSDMQKMEDHFLKVDLLHFLVVIIILAALIVALTIWDSRAHVLATFTTNLLSFLKLQF